VTTGTWPTVDERLVRHYRRLLLAYPGNYRRRYGMEMVTTLLEMAEPGRSRPSASEAWHLLASGVRQRFRLPAARPAVVATAVLVTVALGVIGAAGGSWLGERTFADLPSEASTLHLLKAAVADPAGNGLSAALREREPGNADSIFVTIPPREQRPDAVPTWTVEEARDGLAAAGWNITEFTIHPARQQGGVFICASDPVSGLPVKGCLDKSEVLRRNATLIAEREGLVLHGYAHDSIGGEPGKIWVGGIGGTLSAARSTAYLPLTVAGGILGALSGWLLVAALAYRIRSIPRDRAQLATAFAGVALTMSALPIGAIVINTVMLGAHLADTQRSVYTLHAVLQPGAYIEGSPPWLIPGCALATAVAGTIAVVLAWSTASQESRGAAQPI
jgi:hypothetical protein